MSFNSGQPIIEDNNKNLNVSLSYKGHRTENHSTRLEFDTEKLTFVHVFV